MLAWCMILFILGVLAFTDTFFGYGEIFRRVDSVIFMLISLGLLVRTSMKMKIKRVEGLIAKVTDLEEELSRFKASTAAQQHKPVEKEPVH
jgi:cytochrome c oxidase subunit IV